MVYEQITISDTDGTVLDTSDFLKLKLRSDSVQTLDNTKWGETVIAMQKQLDEEPLRI